MSTPTNRAVDQPYASQPGSSEHHAHRLERTVERVQHQAERLERHGAKQRLVLGLAEHDGGCGTPSLELEDALAHAARERRAIGKNEFQLTFRLEAERPPLAATKH